MKHQVTPLFSVPLYKTVLDPLDPMEESWIKNLKFPPQSVGLYDAENEEPKNAGMQVLNQPQLKNLRQQILKVMNHFVSDVLDIEQDFELTTSWVNKNGKGDHIVQHSHPNAMISGVYYVESDDTSAPIIFNKPYFYTNLFHETIKPTFRNKNQNQYNVDYYGMKPKKNDLYMFPSWLEHTVPPQDADKDRLSLAFNFFVKGKVGVGTTQLQL
jgi:uncharacterized protein (TIGR02466 family)